MDNQFDNKTEQNHQPAPVAPPDPVNPSPGVVPEQPAEAPQPVPNGSFDAAPASQPQPTYTPPVAPAPIGSMPGTQYQMPPKKKLSKGALFGIIAGAVGLVMILVGVILVVALNTPSREDYVASLDKLESMSDTNSNIASALRSSSDDDIDGVDSEIATLRTASEELSKMKAVKPKESREHYTNFANKLESNLVVVEEMVESHRQTSKITDEVCTSGLGSAGGDINAFQSASKKCTDTIDEVVREASSQDLKDYLNRIKQNVETISEAGGKVSALADPYGKDYDAYRSLMTQYNDALTDLTDADDDYQQSFTDRLKETDPAEAASDFADYLTDKANGGK